MTKYIAEIDQVREVCLHGEALVAPWAAELAALGLRPATALANRVPMMLCATSAKFRGIRFREFSVSLLAFETETNVQGWYLAHAFNSSRMFAWIERKMFATPYYHGAVEVDAATPARIRAASGGGRIEAAMAMAATGRGPLRRGLESWEGPLFLPSRGADASAPRKWFQARLRGDAEVYRFDPHSDRVNVTPDAKWPVLAQLCEADFRGNEWLLRIAGNHARSKTFRRPATWPV